jgi:ABC-type multidrug transport system permease subunit
MKHNLKILWHLTAIQYKEFYREPGIFFWSIIFPVMMAWVLGIAFSKRNEMIQTIALVETGQQKNERLAEFLGDNSIVHQSGQNGPVMYFKSVSNDKLGKYTYHILQVTWDSALLMLKRGQTSIIIKDVTDSIYFYFDAQNSDARLTYLLLAAAMNNEQTIHDSASIKLLEEKGTRYIDFLVPGLLAMGIMNSFLWGIGYGLIEMRAKKLLRRMVATPMKKSLYIFSHFFGRISLALIEAGVLFLFSWIYFRISIQGSLSAFILIFLAGSFCFTGLAILMASRTSSSRIGNGLINLITMPMMILSGIFFSYHNFPEMTIPFIQKLPLTMLADSMRSIITEGAGLKENVREFILLSSIGALCFAAGLRIYKWY